MAIAVLIVVAFLIPILLIEDQYQLGFATAFVLGLSLSLLMGRGFKRQSKRKQIGNAVRTVIRQEQRQGGMLSR